MRALVVIVTVIVTVAVFATTTGNRSAADETAVFDPQRFAAVFARLRGDTAAKAAHAFCPADVFMTRKPFWLGVIDAPEVGRADCEERPSECLAGCLDGRFPQACFALALAVQQRMGDSQQTYAEMAFALACASGKPGGCTNRAAGIRNGDYQDDPFGDRLATERHDCLFRSFRLACREGDSWGCTMLGQAYEYGEGVEADARLARQSFERACELAPEFASCDMARERLAGMK